MNKILKNISWLFFDRIIRIFGGLFVGIWMARYLGPSDFGLLNYALAYSFLFMLFGNLGLEQIVIRELVKYPEQINELLGTAFTLKMIGSITGLAVIGFSLIFIEIDILTKAMIFIVSLNFIFQSLDVIDFFFQSRILSKYVVIARNGAFLLSSLLKIFLILNKYSVIYFAVANCLDVFMAAGFLMLIYVMTGNHLSAWQFKTETAKRLLSYCWPLAITAFLIAAHMRIDQVMIGNMLNKHQVGVYSVAVSLSEAWYFIPGIIVSTLMPYFAELRENNKTLYYEKLMHLYSLMFWMGAAVGCFTIVLGKKLIVCLFGNNYTEAYAALIFNIWNGIFISQAIARGIWLINEDLQKFRLYNNLIIVTLNITLNFFLIPFLGISGSAIATLVTQLAGTWLVSFLWKPLRRSTFSMIKSVNPIYLINGFKSL